MIVEVGVGAPADDAGAIVDLGDALLVPGFVDLQCNGTGVDDLASTDVAGWHRVGATLARHGTTSFCGTLVSASPEAYAAPLANADRVRRVRGAGEPDGPEAELLGIHLEGPFLGGAPGAHDPTRLRGVDLVWLDALLHEHPGLVRLVTLAPEADPGFVGTRHLAAAGVVVALGHSTASYGDARAAADAGASVVTHLFNGMGPFHHREPGLAGAALDDDRLVPTVIADGVHVHPAVLRVAFASATRVAVVSDAVATTGAVSERDGAARLSGGTLAGATGLLDRSLAVLAAAAIPVEVAVGAMTRVPAEILGLADRGRLDEGCRADVVALDPATFAPRRVWIGGVERPAA